MNRNRVFPHSGLPQLPSRLPQRLPWGSAWALAAVKRSRPCLLAAVAALAGGFSGFNIDALSGPGTGLSLIRNARAQDSERRDRGDRDRGDRDRGDRDRGDRDRRRWDPKEFVGRIDENGNGVLEPSETGGRSRYFLEGAARDAGLDLSRDIPVAKMVEAMEKRNAAREASSNSSSSSSSSGSASPAPSSSGAAGSSSGGGFGSSGLGGSRSGSSGSTSNSSGGASGSSSGSSKGGFPGFGESPTAPKPPGFDVPLAPRTTSGTAASSTQYDRRVIEYVDRMMADYDSNKDGVLDKAEIDKAPWQSDPKESDLNKDGRLDRDELNQRIARRFGYTPRSSSPSGGSASGSGSSGSSGGSASGSGDAARVKAYAEGLLKQNDANKNGVLDKDEWANVRSITRDTDANNDGMVTLDELTTKLGSFGSGSGSSSSTASSGSGSSGSSGGSGSGGSSSGSGYSGYRSSSGSGYGSSRGDTKQSGEKRSYRQRTVAERMPKGLPDWFARNDEDADGQITMSEYATLWSDAKATEFAKFDLDGDGVITPRECLRSQEMETQRK